MPSWFVWVQLFNFAFSIAYIIFNLMEVLPVGPFLIK